MPKRSKNSHIPSMTDEELEQREKELEEAFKRRNDCLNGMRAAAGENFTPLGDHARFTEMRNAKTLREREAYLMREVQDEKRRRKEKREKEAAEAAPAVANPAMSAAIAEYLEQEKKRQQQKQLEEIKLQQEQTKHQLQQVLQQQQQLQQLQEVQRPHAAAASSSTAAPPIIGIGALPISSAHSPSMTAQRNAFGLANLQGTSLAGALTSPDGVVIQPTLGAVIPPPMGTVLPPRVETRSPQQSGVLLGTGLTQSSSASSAIIGAQTRAAIPLINASRYGGATEAISALGPAACGAVGSTALNFGGAAETSSEPHSAWEGGSYGPAASVPAAFRRASPVAASETMQSYEAPAPVKKKHILWR